MDKIINKEILTRHDEAVNDTRSRIIYPSNIVDCLRLDPIKNIIITQLREQISQNAELTGWDVTIVDEKTIELKKRVTDLTYSEKYDDRTFQKMCCSLVSHTVEGI
jgi:hypothetical protein